MIRCAVCNKPVERFERWNDYVKNREVWTVFCHGKKQTVKLDARDILNAKHIEFGAAFEDEFKQLEPPQ